jgi:hypothetical protein
MLTVLMQLISRSRMISKLNGISLSRAVQSLQGVIFCLGTINSTTFYGGGSLIKPTTRFKKIAFRRSLTIPRSIVTLVYPRFP